MNDSLPPVERRLISVIMPCFNAGAFLAEAVGSALDDQDEDVEVVIVDDGSEDNSVDVARSLAAKYPGRVTLGSSARRGPYPARNQALALARGSLVAFLDADDWWAPGTLRKLRSALDAHQADVAYCGWQNVGIGLNAPPYVPPDYLSDDVSVQFLRSCPWPIHAALIRRTVLDSLGGFSEQRYSSMDYHFWLRLLGLTRNMVRVPEALAFYRWHGSGQVSAVKWRQVLDALWAQNDFIRNYPDRIAHLPQSTLQDLTEGSVRRQAYRALWSRDVVSAHTLFRHVRKSGAYSLSDLRHILTAMLPLPMYKALLTLRDRPAARRKTTD